MSNIKEDNKIVIIDSGSNFTRIGYSFDLFPRYTFPTVAGFTNKLEKEKDVSNKETETDQIVIEKKDNIKTNKKNDKTVKKEEEESKEVFLGNEAIKRQ
jgi:actin-related protein